MRHVVVVGASSGLGLAIARRFARVGERVTGVARREMGTLDGLRWIPGGRHGPRASRGLLD